MNAVELVQVVQRTAERWAQSREELRALDAALGDGDLGVTVSAGCEAVRDRLKTLEPQKPAEVVKQAGMAFAAGNPSTMAALLGGALLAAAKTLGDTAAMDSKAVLACGRAVAESIAARGKAELGDKTILDALVPSLDAAEAASDGQRLHAAITAARQGIDESAGWQSKRGRAAWLGERSAGHPDPGATAYLRFLEALSEEYAKGTR